MVFTLTAGGMLRKIIKFKLDCLKYLLRGSSGYYGWIFILSFFTLLMFYTEGTQIMEGMIVTGLSDQVTWGIYVANFVFLVGMAASGVTVVFPAYVYKHKGLHDVVPLGESLAIASVVMCNLFILSHIGRPEMGWHMLPVVGIFNFPGAMLAWDVIVLTGYLVLNLIALFYMLYKRYLGEVPNKAIYMPVVYLSIFWALSIHTVTAFLFSTLPARPYWHHSILPVKFVATAFAAGAGTIILSFLVIRKVTDFKIDDSAIDLLSQVVVWTLGLGLFLFISEVVTELYAGTEHSYGLQYLIYGKHGFSGQVPWFWVSTVLMVGAFLILMTPKLRRDHSLFLPLACVMAGIGIWIEKGLNFVLPGMTPTPIGEFVEYTPSWYEIITSIGHWALGLIIFTLLAKISIGILSGKIRYDDGAVKGEGGDG